MKYNKIGYGTWPLSGDANGAVTYGKVNDDDSKMALREAFKQGVNLYDTADFYGYGHVENLMGEVFEEFRSNISIVTKGGMVSNEGKQDFSPDHLFSSLEQSLKRLRTDFVDIYMLHSPPLSVLEDGKVLSFLQTLVKENYIKEYGISLIGPADGEKAVNIYGIRVIEVNYNILDMRAERNGLFDLCKEKDVKVVVRTPLAQGILTGKFQFSDDKSDRRNAWSKERVEKQTVIYKKMVDSLNPNNYTNSQNCLRFCLTNPKISVIIPGMKTVNEVIENLDSQNFPPLTKEEELRIIDIYNEEML